MTADANSRLAVQIMGSARPKSDSKQNHNDHEDLGKEEEKESDVVRKIREAQEAAQKVQI